jgi:hypothetical protein
MSPAVVDGLKRLEALCDELETRIRVREDESEVLLCNVVGESAATSTNNTLMRHAIAAKALNVGSVRVKLSR